MNRKDDCIFCKIVAGEAPSHRVYEDDHVLVFEHDGQVDGLRLSLDGGR